MSDFRVSIEQDDCTSCSLCPEVAPTYFYMGEDQVAYVKDKTDDDPQTPEFEGAEAGVDILDDDLEKVIDAAESCPGACIYISPVVEVVEV